MNAEKKQVHFVSLGCAKNLVDTEVLMGFAKRNGWGLCASPEEADIIVVNTCSFIAPAKEESIEVILEMAGYKDFGRPKKIVVAGCLAQRYPDDLSTELPEADHFIGTGDLPLFEELLRGTGLPRINVGRPDFLMDARTPRGQATAFHTVNVKLSEGCSNGCSFCVIPRLRGRLRSRPIPDILEEIRRFKASGAVEFNLIGQNLTAYGDDLGDGSSLAVLLREPEIASGDHWLRLHYLYPKRVDRKLLQAISEAESVLPYIDMPLQHIDGDILSAMGRSDDENSTRSAVEGIREIMPEAVLRTSMIVGFPGESEKKFEKLIDFVEESRFDRLGVFAYSREEGARAASLPDQIGEEEKDRRLGEIMSVQRSISREKLKSLRGKTVEVLVEGVSEESELLLAGRYWGQAMDIDGVTYLSEGTAKPGEIIPVEITDSHDYDLVGLIIDGERDVE